MGTNQCLDLITGADKHFIAPCRQTFHFTPCRPTFISIHSLAVHKPVIVGIGVFVEDKWSGPVVGSMVGQPTQHSAADKVTHAYIHTWPWFGGSVYVMYT